MDTQQPYASQDVAARTNQLPPAPVPPAAQQAAPFAAAAHPLQPPTPGLADDADLIENEWVAAVKRVLHENHADPYMASRAMTALRADYLKKRYNKDIKIAE